MSDRRTGAHGAPLVQLSLFNGGPAQESPVSAPPDPDADARVFAADPRFNVVLEASAGTGKTSVLVARYVNLLKAGIDPANILAITFTRKAAAEMRERIVGELRAAAARSEFDRARWLELRDRLGDIAISTIDAFCLSMLREFPLEADVDPAFDLADETEVPRLVATALDRTLRILTGMARTDRDIALVLAQLGIARTREGLATLIDRRLVAWDALDRFLSRGPRELTADSVCQAAAASLREALQAVPGGLSRFLADGPSAHPRFELFRREVQHLDRLRDAPEATVRAALERVTSHFLTNDGTARKPGTQVYPYKVEHYPSKDASRRHRDALFQLAPQIAHLAFAFNRDLNAVMARGVRRMFGVALAQYRQALEERSVLDFSDVLERARDLLRRMDEFSQSRYRLEARYHHVLVDEFQDTSRAQWELVSLLVRAWGEGAGLATNPSVFIVGDRKQSIYRFRDAEVAVLQDAAEFIEGLRPGTRARRSIARSFRAVPELLQFVNDLFAEIARPATRADDFTYDERDRFPGAPSAVPPIRGPVLGLAAGNSPEECAAAVADEIVRLLEESTVRDKSTGVPRRVRPGDIAILFRSRSSHREFERELGARGVATYVYKGLGFFDADEIKDLSALVRYLADPWSPRRVAALLRSRFVRLSDRGLAALAADLPDVLLAPE
ncbi:MAG: UvrD-helicase domain-containing protein, partial [Vicinamibacterales bacterium]